MWQVAVVKRLINLLGGKAVRAVSKQLSCLVYADIATHITPTQHATTIDQNLMFAQMSGQSLGAASIVSGIANSDATQVASRNRMM